MSSLTATTGLRVRRRVASSPWHMAWRRYRRNRVALAGGAIAVLILLVAILAPLLAPGGYEYSNLSETLQGPSLRHWLGTDPVGRDLYSRLVYGARTSMTVGFLVPLMGIVIGVPLGACAGWFGRSVDFITLRLIELATTVPPLLIGLLLIALYGSGLFHVALFLGATAWIGFARITRAQFLTLRDREFVVSARALGVPPWRTMLTHVLPNAAGPIVIYFVQYIPIAVFGEAGYSFLGLGVQDPIPSWGKMITDGERYLSLDPLVGLLPMLCIAVATLSFSFLGDGLRDALDTSVAD
jgi:ABC-type dipeptide/oligopeptide/nickel transport system permease subunit